jgi:soluble lytic murein transglycosylase-like protein
MACLGATAQAQPRVLILHDADVAAYTRAFAAAETNQPGMMREALSRVVDTVLTADVEATLLLSEHSAAPREAFHVWLSRNADHPLANAVSKRAIALGHRGLPQAAALRTRAYPHASARPPGDSAAARAHIESAFTAFGEGDVVSAESHAQMALQGPRASDAAWLMGLIAWRRGDVAAAASWFDRATAPHQDMWRASAGAYWAGRAHLANSNAASALAAFKSAARHNVTFYGQLAQAQLGMASPLDFSAPALDANGAAQLINSHPGARRAAAFAQLGYLSDVERELHAVHARAIPREDRALLALAMTLQAPAAQLRIAEYGGADVAAGYCPRSPFQPAGGFRLDRALVYAIVRQESRFSPIAVSRSNARGLMQLLPATAQDMEKSLPIRANPDALHDPALNMRLGQDYVEWLNTTFRGDGDLTRILAGYNGGPGWLSRWEARVGRQDDPLLLLESLPRAESRDYAERVLSHMALCRKRFGQHNAELVSLANGAAPYYRALDR